MRRHAMTISLTAFLVCSQLAAVPVTRADSLTQSISPVAPTPMIAPLTPARLFDSRSNGTTVDGTGAGDGMLTAGAIVHVPVAGRGGALAGSDAVVVNIAALHATVNGYVKAWACSAAEPGTSVVNFTAGAAPISNNAIVALGASDLCVKASAATHLLVDLVGQFPAGSGDAPDGRRLVDSRVSILPPLFPPLPARMHAGEWRRLTSYDMPGEGVFNVTVVNPQAAGYATIDGCDQSPRPGRYDPQTGLWSDDPTLSTINFGAHQTVANLLIDYGALGGLCVFASADADIVIDVVGALPLQDPTHATAFNLVSGRVLDSRTGHGTPPHLLPVGVTQLTLWPESTESYWTGEHRAAVRAMNVVAVGAATDGYLTFYPCDQPRPGTSTMNFAAGRATAHLSLLPVDTEQSLCVYASTAVHLVIDGEAWMMTTPQPLQVALWAGEWGCAGFVVSTDTLTTTQERWPSSAPVTYSNTLDVVGGTAPYAVTVDTPAGWTSTVASVAPPTEPPEHNLDLTWSNTAGFSAPFDATITIVDAAGASVSVIVHHVVRTHPPLICDP